MDAEKVINHFSSQFEVLYNSISSNKAPSINEYEKSVLLTKAQNELVKNYFDPASKGNAIGKGFDESAIRQMDFSNILLSDKKELAPSDTGVVLADPRELVCDFPDKVFIIVNEQVFLNDGTLDTPLQRQVIPLSFQEYMRLMSKPFKEPLKQQAWRLNVNDGNAKNKASIILCTPDKDYSEKNYFIRYVKKPNPIILEDLSEYGYSIEGETEKSACELNEGTWDAIIQRAVELAKITWYGDANEVQLQMTSGQRSE